MVRKYPEARKVFVIGEPAMRAALEAEGLTVIGCETHILDPTVIINETKFDN